MPCYEPRESPAAIRAECAETYRHNSPVAEMLCEVIRYIERVTGPHAQIALREFSPELQQWWHEHKARDTRKAAIKLATGIDLDMYGAGVGKFRFQGPTYTESDIDFRKRILREI